MIWLVIFALATLSTTRTSSAATSRSTPMPEQPSPIRGPLYVEATPLVVTLDASPLVSNNVHDLLTLLRSDEFIDSFMELDTADGLAFEELHAALVARLATKVRLTGREAVRIGERLTALGEERSIPEQRGEAAA